MTISPLDWWCRGSSWAAAPNRSAFWTRQMDWAIMAGYENGDTVDVIAQVVGASRPAVVTRLIALTEHAKKYRPSMALLP